MNNKLEDNSNDRSYFVITPQLVWALCRDPYEYTLWGVVKMIAGEQGECMLATPDLASAAMMSAGKVSECRRRLLDSGLLVGEFRRDPGYPQPVWHLTVPDLWAENLAWREENKDLLARIEGKRQQRKSLHQVNPTEEPSPGEEGITPGDRGITPGETKKNHIEPKEELGADALFSPPTEQERRPAKPKVKAFKSTGDPFMDIVAGAALRQERGVPDWAVLGAEGLHPVFPVVRAFCELTGQDAMLLKKAQGQGWLKQFEKLGRDHGVSVKQLLQAHEVLPDKEWGEWHLQHHKWNTPFQDSYVDLVTYAARQIRDGTLETVGKVIRIRN